MVRNKSILSHNVAGYLFLVDITNEHVPYTAHMQIQDAKIGLTGRREEYEDKQDYQSGIQRETTEHL